MPRQPGCCCGCGPCVSCSSGTPCKLKVTLPVFSPPGPAHCQFTTLANQYTVKFLACGESYAINGDVTGINATGTYEKYAEYESTFDLGDCGEGDSTLRIRIFVLWSPSTGDRAILIYDTFLSGSVVGTVGVWVLQETAQTDPYDCKSFTVLHIPHDTGYPYSTDAILDS